MKNLAFVSAILAGYAAMSMGILKILWRQFGVHFYASGMAHEPQASVILDVVLIATLIGAGLCLVTLNVVVPALFLTVAVCLFEFLHLHDDPHDLWQTLLTISLIVGQVMALFFNLAALKADVHRFPRDDYS